MLRWILLAVLLASFSPVAAQTVAERFKSAAPAGFVEAFVGHCARNPGRNDKIRAAASALGFTPLTGDMLAMLGPQDPNTSFSGWIVTEDVGAPFLLGVSEGSVDGVTMNICTLSNPFLDASEVVAEFPKWFGTLKVLGDEVSLGQRVRAWSADEIAEEAVITVTDAGPSGQSGATLALMAPEE